MTVMDVSRSGSLGVICSRVPFLSRKSKTMQVPQSSSPSGTSAVHRVSPHDPLELMALLRVDSARLARIESHRSCNHPVGGEHSMCGDDCGWFHGAWQYLLFLGLSASPERNLPFYQRELRRAAAAHSHRKILIAGCSDHAMLAIVLSAINTLSCIPLITVVDRCETPLFLCRWFADRLGCEITTQKADLVSYEPEEKFDIICTDGLLSNLQPTGRTDIVLAWHRLLNPDGGVLITTNNIRSVRKNNATWRSPDMVSALCDRAVRLKNAMPIDIELSDEALYDLAHEFFAHPKSQSVSSTGEFESYFHPSKFVIEQLTYSEINGNALRDAEPNGELRKTLNARIVARRA